MATLILSRVSGSDSYALLFLFFSKVARSIITKFWHMFDGDQIFKIMSEIWGHPVVYSGGKTQGNAVPTNIFLVQREIVKLS